jgi:Protein kinase domain/PEGA domain/zinc-ribbon domain
VQQTPPVCPHCETPVVEGFRFCPSCGADTTDPSSRPKHYTTSDQLLQQLRGVVGDRFEIHGMLGRGGMGVVFRATETKLRRQVAIKVLPPEFAAMEDVAERFQREARTAAQLDHPNIVPIYAVEDEGELQYFVMKFVDGHGLDDEQDGAVPWERVQQILHHAALALGHAHSRGVVHRDVKPGNIMIDTEGRILLADFGISKALEGSTMTATGTVIGTPAFMSPEQAAGTTIDGRSDQYSLGIVGYTLLAGRLPFDEASIASYLYKQAYEEVPPLESVAPDTPAFLVEAINRALNKKPDDRFPTMEEFASAVWPEGGVVPAGTPVSAARRAAEEPRPGGRRWAMTASAAVVVVALVAAVALMRPRAARETDGTAPRRDSFPDATMQLAAGSAASDSLPQTGETAAQPARAEPSPPQTLPSAAPPAAARPADNTTPTTQPVAVGYLTVGASPWGTVVIDGVEAGNTPLTRHELPPGDYVIQVRRTGYLTTVDTVSITAGNATILRKVLVAQ